MKQKIKEIILENQAFSVEKYIIRENIAIPQDSGLIISIIGSRRSGKTYYLYHLIKELKENGVPPHNIVFINFEDERLNFTSDNLDIILQSYQELYPEQDLSKVYFFFDEIQNVRDWEKFIRRIYDTKTRRIFITGSNSKLLSSEIATELRGRTVSYTLFPFSYREYLQSQVPNLSLNQASGRAKAIQLSQKFILEGGFPELTRFEKAFKIKVLQEYFNVMIYRDIIERFSISNTEVLKYFIKKVFSSVTTPLSVNKRYNDIKSMGYKVSNKYLYEYLDHCNAIYLTQSVDKYSYSELKQAKSDKKVYVIDTGLLTAIDFKLSDNWGKLLENQVALEFLKKGATIFYYKEQYECDFLVQTGHIFNAVQVCWSLKENETEKRELRGLVQACKTIQQKEGIVITFDEEREFEHEGIFVKVIPFYKHFF